MVMKFFVDVAKNLRRTAASALLSYPKNIQCNVCGWSGRRFMSDPWHKHINCPSCYQGIRQRLFYAALQHIENLTLENLICNKSILHFAPEEIIRPYIQHRAARYVTTDFLRSDCDLKLDMSSMPEVGNESFDAVIAFDVLEHVPDYRQALVEVHRILSPGGFAIFTVPQKDNLAVTYEDPNIVSPDDRLKHFGQRDHLRIFGRDFTDTVENKGFLVTAVDESFFSEELTRRHVLFPPQLSKHPLATNHRKVFFCKKN
jgi:SAM-dependent methyltransferase